MTSNMTDKEIKKALEEVLKLMLCDGDLQRSSTISHTIDLINRLQAENERLRKAVNRLTNRVCDLKEKDETRHKVYMTKCEELEIAKAEAYKEFAERLKEKSKFNMGLIYGKVVYFEEIDNLLKEMVGE